MTDGSMGTTVVAPTAEASNVGWAGNSRILLTAGLKQMVFVPKTGFQIYVAPDEYLQADATGTLWKQITARDAPDAGQGYTTVALPDQPATDTPAFAPGAVVRLEVELGTPEISTATAGATALSLQQAGFRIGSGGWLLKVTYHFKDSASRLEDASGNATIPAARDCRRYEVDLPRR